MNLLELLMNFKIFSFYTEKTPYENEVHGFVESCQKFDIPFSVMKTQNQGSWVKNVNLKPYLCLQMFEKNDCPIVYLDIDARILSYPILFDIDEDITIDEFQIALDESKEIMIKLLEGNE